jgi:hypothetical protein
MQCFAPWQYILLSIYWLLQLNPYAMLSSMAIQTITTIVVDGITINHNNLLCGNSPKVLQPNKLFCCLSLLSHHILQQLSMKVILLLLEGITTNMTLL